MFHLCHFDLDLRVKKLLTCLLLWWFAGDFLVHGVNVFSVLWKLCGSLAMFFIQLLLNTVPNSTYPVSILFYFLETQTKEKFDTKCQK